MAIPSAKALVFCILINISQLARVGAGYSQDYCDQFVGDLAEDNPTPYFYDDYMVLAERTLLTSSYSDDNPFWQQEVAFSTSNKQALLSQDDAKSNFFFYVDENAQDCVYGVMEGVCEELDDTCGTVVDLDNFVVEDSKGLVSIGSSSASMKWPDDIRYQVDAGAVEQRAIKCEGYTTCSYNSDNDETVVSEWYVLSTSDYTQMDQSKKPVVFVTHHRQRAGSDYDEEKIEYTNYRGLSSDTEIKLPETSCTSIQGSSFLKEISEPANRFKYSADILIQNQTATFFMFEDYEFDFDTKIAQTTATIPTSDVNLQVHIKEVIDYSTGYKYLIDLSSGACSVKSSDKTTMPTAKEYWGITSSTDIIYVGEYLERDTQVDFWYLVDPKNSKVDMTRLYLATDEWLQTQGRSQGEFYPVELMTASGSEAAYISVVEFKDQGYQIPGVSNCYDSSTLCSFEVIIEIDYDSINSDLKSVEEAFRNKLLSVTGIVSVLRIAYISFYYHSYMETVAYFQILGQLRDDVDNARDPVTVEEAEQKIIAAIEDGSFTLTLPNQNTDTSLKKDSLINYNNWSEPASYSSGSMAAVGIFLLLIGLALGLGAVWAYNRYSRKSMPGGAISFSNEDFQG